jgi:hypothetical protein
VTRPKEGARRYEYGPRWLIRVIKNRNTAERLFIIRNCLPKGWTLSSPEREKAIANMETTLTIITNRPTQYSRYAARPPEDG